MRLKLMWDYDAFPVWQVHGPGGMLAPEALRLSARLTGDLRRWSDDWTAAMWGDKGPDAPGWGHPRPRRGRTGTAGAAGSSPAYGPSCPGTGWSAT